MTDKTKMSSFEKENDKKQEVKKQMLQFRRYSKQPYWKPDQKDTNDDIMVGDYFKTGCCWEFRIEEVLLMSEYAIRICIFNDAVKSLGNSCIVKMLHELEKTARLDEVELVLKRNGIKEVIDAKKSRFE